MKPAWRSDLTAALTVTFLGIPQGLAYALIADLPPIVGLYAATLPATVGSLFRSSRHVVSGPTNALSLLVGGVVGALAATHGASPTEVADDYLSFMRDNVALDATTQFFGPNLRFRESKVNAKLPGTATHLKYHQDLPFGPLTNQDLITVLFLLDEVTNDNGPLEVVPGSHHGPLYDHWHDGVFTGAVSEEVAGWAAARSVTCLGPERDGKCSLRTTHDAHTLRVKISACLMSIKPRLDQRNLANIQPHATMYVRIKGLWELLIQEEFYECNCLSIHDTREWSDQDRADHRKEYDYDKYARYQGDRVVQKRLKQGIVPDGYQWTRFLG